MNLGRNTSPRDAEQRTLGDRIKPPAKWKVDADDVSICPGLVWEDLRGYSHALHFQQWAWSPLSVSKERFKVKRERGKEAYKMMP